MLTLREPRSPRNDQGLPPGTPESPQAAGRVLRSPAHQPTAGHERGYTGELRVLRPGTETGSCRASQLREGRQGIHSGKLGTDPVQCFEHCSMLCNASWLPSAADWSPATRPLAGRLLTSTFAPLSPRSASPTTRVTSRATTPFSWAFWQCTVCEYAPLASGSGL